MTEIYNRSDEKAKRRILRQNIPPAEQILWASLRDRQRQNCKFRRQYSIYAYVVDFYAPELKLAIEVDGPSHQEPGAAEYDSDRQASIEAIGIQFLRFTNRQIYHELDEVLRAIDLAIGRSRRIGTSP